MIISVASGKGGTGKTTLAANLAYAIKKEIQILDCDVEAPNAHLFIKPLIDETETIFTPFPEVDEQKCKLCGKCADICRFKAISVIGKTVLTFPEMCHGCGGCLRVCPENAITENGRNLGVVEIGMKDHIRFVHGRLRVGEAMAPPLIKAVRSFGSELPLTIIDAPPGTSCPVITAIKDTDFVLMVTEPTPFGLNDLKLGVETVRSLDLPCGIVINRCDVGDEAVKRYAETENIPILMEIPFDRKIAEIYASGELLLKHLPEYEKLFYQLYLNIQALTKGAALL